MYHGKPKSIPVTIEVKNYFHLNREVTCESIVLEKIYLKLCKYFFRQSSDQQMSDSMNSDRKSQVHIF